MTTTRPADNRPWNSRPFFSRPGREAVAALFAWGGDGGYNSEGDVLVNKTADGVDLNRVWDEVASVMSRWNKQRSSLASLISYSTTNIADAMPQVVQGAKFEKASEYGEPEGHRPNPDAMLLGYDFDDWDVGARMTWKFLRNATAEQVRAVVNDVLEGDNGLVTGALLRRLFDPTEGLSPELHKVYGLWNGTDGETPPPSPTGQEFPSTTSHYLASGNSVLDPGDLTDAISQVRSKGFGIRAGSQLLVLCNDTENEIISTFRAGQETGGVESRFDFIPSATAPAYLTSETIIGQVAPGEFGGLEVSGSYGPAWVIPSQFIPAGYIAVVASGGPNSSLNPVAFRQHVNPAYQGLRMLPGRDQRYPLIESHYQRSFGTGVRYRGAACIVQVTPGNIYTPPSDAWWS
ncbi:hypothetical protein GS479_19360 [Rhodococcus hoagii]|nr:hypothetical protein [Prescottella equi]